MALPQCNIVEIALDWINNRAIKKFGMEFKMLTLQDMLDFCDGAHPQAEAIAEEQKAPMAFAADLGRHLLTTPEGLGQLHYMMLDNMRHALENGHQDHLVSLTRIFLDFHRNYPLTAPVAMAAA